MLALSTPRATARWRSDTMKSRRSLGAGGRIPASPPVKFYSAFHIHVVSSGLERIPPNQARRRGQPHLPPRDRVRYRAHCAYLTPSPRSRCGCRTGSTSRRSHGSGEFAPGRWTIAGRVHCRAGRSGVAVDRAQPDGDQSEKQRRRPPPRTTKPGRPRHDSDRYCRRVVFPGCRP